MRYWSGGATPLEPPGGSKPCSFVTGPRPCWPGDTPGTPVAYGVDGAGRAARSCNRLRPSGRGHERQVPGCGIGEHVHGPRLDPWPPQSDGGAFARAAGLIAVAEDLACEFSLRPLLERILRRCTELLGCDAGSICSVDEAAGTYRKEADIGVACQSGRVFPLTEGMTGAVVARRGAGLVRPLRDVPGGHVAPEERAALRGVIGVPLDGAGRIIGACIVFSRDDRAHLRGRRRRAAAACSPSTPRSRWRTPGCTRRPRSGPGPRPRRRNATGCSAEVHDTLTRRLVSIRVHLEVPPGPRARGPEARRGGAGHAAKPARRPGRPWPRRG